MVSMNKLLLISILMLYSLWAQAEVQVQIDPSPVTQGEHFQLTLTQVGSQGRGVPNLKSLQKDFLILGTTRQVNYTVINGQSSINNQWIITLKPLKSGVLSIPSIKIGSELTTPMTINVEKPNTQQQTPNLDDHALLLKTSVDLEHPYVNQQIIYTVKLFNSKRLIDAQYEAPQAEDALIIPLGDAKRYQTTQNETDYVVEEQRYAVFPQKSGILKITSPSFTALIYEFNPQRVKAQDKEREIQVKPIPQQDSGRAWLPAKKIQLTEHYENLNQNLSQGSTLVRTIAVEGVGLPAQLLPNLSFKGADGFSAYPEKGAERNQVRQGELVGATEYKVTYLVNKSGKVIIPEVRLPWFNTQTGKEELALLAPRSIDVIPASNISSPIQKKQPPALAEKRSRGPMEQSNGTQYFGPWFMTVLFGCAWVCTLLLWGWQKRYRFLGENQHKVALKKLRIACAASNPQEARDALLKWAAVHWPEVTLLNLGDLSQLVRDPQLKKQVSVLSQMLYKNNKSNLWRGDDLFKAVDALHPLCTAVKQRASDLPPINPS
jgi:hypothetical protein